MQDSVEHWLRAVSIKSLGIKAILEAKNYFGSLTGFFAADEALLRKCGFTAQQIEQIHQPYARAIHASLNWQSASSDRYLLTVDDPRYPTLLKESLYPPLMLYAEGNIAALNKNQFAIVGSRRASLQGKHNAKQFASTLAVHGLSIVSGLAIGIDAACHQGVLHVNETTIAVLGSGLNRIYPAINQQLAADIKMKGLLLSEFPPDTPPLAKHFPQRNRVIAGLSLGVLIVEAAPQSGSLITAKYALQNNREIFALPGSIHQPLSKGCHSLIKQGSKLVETTEDILEELQIPPMTQAAYDKTNVITISSQAQNILDLIEYEYTSHDVIILRSGLTASEVSSILLTLELQGLIQSVSGGFVKVATKNLMSD